MKDKEKNIPLTHADEAPEGLRETAALFKKAALYKPPEGAKHRIWRSFLEKRSAPDNSMWAQIFSPRRFAYIGAVAAVFVMLAVFYKPAPDIENTVNNTVSASVSKTIHTGKDEKQLFKPNNFIKVFAHSATSALLLKTQSENENRIELKIGALSVFVTPGSNQKFSIYTGRADYSVVGTSFYISHKTEKLDVLSVYSGKVKVITASGIDFVSAGNCAIIRRNTKVGACKAMRGSRPDEFAGVPEAPEKSLGVKPAANNQVSLTEQNENDETPGVTDASKAVAEDINKTGADEALKQTQNHPISEQVKPAAKEASNMDKWLALQTEMITMPPDRRLVAIKGFLGNNPGAVRRSEVLAALADAYKGTNRPKEAFEIYQKLYHLNKTGLWRESALYEMGFIANYSLNSPRDSIKYWSEQRRNFPYGSLKEEADFHVARAQIAIGRFDEAGMNLENFTKQYIGSPHRPTALYLLASIYREHKNACKKAIDAYESYLAVTTSKSPMREEALYWRAACLEKVGDRQRAQNAFSDYLNRYPNGKYASEVNARIK